MTVVDEKDLPEATDRKTASGNSTRPAGYWAALKGALAIFADADTSMRCAAVGFFSFLGLFPAIAAALIIFGILADPQLVRGLMSDFTALLPERVAELLENQLSRLANAEAEQLGLGLLLALVIGLWSGSRGINALTHALTMVARDKTRRSFLYNAAVSIGLTLGALVIAPVVFASLTILPAVLAWVPLPLDTESLVLSLRWPILAGLFVIATLVLYRFGPEGKPTAYKKLLPGAILATLLWLAGSLAFSFYAENFANYDATFGGLAAVALLMLWFYYSAMIFVFGWAFNQTHLAHVSGQQGHS